MKNTVAYSVVPKRNPMKPESAPLYYAAAQAKAVADISTLSNRINSMCTVTHTDVVAVLSALETVMAKSLMNGEIVRLNGFGSFQVSISSIGAASHEAFNASFIRSSHYVFRPGIILAAALKIIRYEQVPTRYKKKKKRKKDAYLQLNPVPI